MASFLSTLNRRSKRSSSSQGEGLLIKKTDATVWPKQRDSKKPQTTILISAREASPEGLLAELAGFNKAKAAAKKSGVAKREVDDLPAWMSTNTSRVAQLNALVPMARRLLQQSSQKDASGRELEVLIKRAVSMAVHELSGEMSITSRDALEATRELLTLVRGKGPLQPLFDDPLVTDIFIDDWDKVRCKRKGKSLETPCIFRTPADYEALCSSILEQANERLTAQRPRVDVVLADEWNSRVNLVHGSMRGESKPGIAIRIPRLRSATMYDLLRSQTLPAPVAAWLSEYMAFGELSTLIIGPTGSGKTTCATALINAVGSDDRVLLLEHLPEIRPASCHVERLRISHPWSEIKSGIGVAEVVDVVRARGPHRVVWGEIRERDRTSFIELLADGYSGSVATMCGEDSYEALHRLARGAEGVSTTASLATTVSRSIGLVLRLQNIAGKSCLMELSEVVPSYGSQTSLRTLIRYEGESNGRRVWRMVASTGGVLDVMAARGVEIPLGPALLPPQEHEGKKAHDGSYQGDSR